MFIKACVCVSISACVCVRARESVCVCVYSLGIDIPSPIVFVEVLNCKPRCLRSMVLPGGRTLVANSQHTVTKFEMSAPMYLPAATAECIACSGNQGAQPILAKCTSVPTPFPDAILLSR